MKQVTQIIRKPKKRRSSRAAWDKTLDSQYKELVIHLEGAGFVVRREELKRGHCWKVMSGTCRSEKQRFIFIDSRLTPDEQVAFLSVKWQEVGVCPAAGEGLAA